MRYNSIIEERLTMDKDMENIFYWLRETEMVDDEDFDDVIEDLNEIRVVAPRFYNMLVLKADR